ncbi:LOW QUALITY PROTEIN: hypothetical protein PanWU01x14_352150 [Parasponia andersonii]|uniref:Uncharacterized protein n=1 Tax=Parasponia andersonii TaxID=3476 RepID=A0A2P5AAE7_PARAD|nr:LOW QUALITY PROTEIN: hypothetical protein PanWU01x14_352150 [Parasponia andersonii]
MSCPSILPQPKKQSRTHQQRHHPPLPLPPLSFVLLSSSISTVESSRLHSSDLPCNKYPLSLSLSLLIPASSPCTSLATVCCNV